MSRKNVLTRIPNEASLKGSRRSKLGRASVEKCPSAEGFPLTSERLSACRARSLALALLSPGRLSGAFHAARNFT